MEVQVVTADTSVVIRLGGRFDFNSHREFRSAADQALATAGAHEIKIDFSSVDYLDSSALGVLLMLRDKAKLVNKTVALANCRGGVKQVIEIANFGKLFKIV